ncbi:MAG: hypothetical protein D6B28_10750 [Gammaproteobacteria bacterium]|nr:MAG: hypothetical protein D6B28_10750 [Gammaproteobacteria bacterium]
MIINSLQAKNFLKYEDLDLNKLPENGIIGITGGNESGKTSIGEAISFALFGRTFAVDYDKLARVIKWGEDSCFVSMVFQIAQNSYKIERTADKQGCCNVKLYRLMGEDHAEQIADGNVPVADSMAQILGYSFAEFIESYYLVQRDIPLPNAGAEAIKQISGVAAYEMAILEHHNQLDSYENQKEQIEKQRFVLNQERELALTFEERLAQLEHDKKGLQDSIQALQDRSQELEKFLASIDSFIEAVKKDAANLAAARTGSSYRQWLELMQDLRMAIGDLESLTPTFADDIPPPVQLILDRVIDFEERLLEFESIYEQLGAHRDEIGVMLGEIAPKTAGNYTVIPAQEKLKLEAETQRNKVLRYFSTTILTILIVFSIIYLSTFEYERSQGFTFAILSGTTVLALVYIVHKLKSSYDSASAQLEMVKEKLKQIKKEAEEIDELINIPLAEAIEYLVEYKDKKITQEAIQYKEGLGSTLTNENELSVLQRDIQREAKVLSAEYNPLIAKANEEQKEITSQLVSSTKALQTVEEKIGEMKNNARMLEDIEQDIVNIEQKLAQQKQQIEDTQNLIEQARQDAVNKSRAFSAGIAKWVTKAIRHLTAGKYSEVRINEQLNVIVHSEQKGDFIEFDEISSGTRRQILLALRIAISQELCESRENHKQMLFLDEPFAFFDKNRVTSSIKALPDLSEELSQVWVVNQELVEGGDFALHIECDESNQTLLL